MANLLPRACGIVRWLDEGQGVSVLEVNILVITVHIIAIPVNILVITVASCAG